MYTCIHVHCTCVCVCVFLTPLTPLFKSSSINNDKYSGDLSFKLIKYSKSCKQTNKQQ